MKIKKIIPLFLAVLIILACRKDEEAPAVLKVEVATIESIANTDGGVTLKGRLKNINGIKNYGFLLSSDSNFYFREVLSLDVPAIEGVFEKQVNSGMRAGMTYYFKSYVEHNKGVEYGERKQFISQGNKSPIITSVSPQEGYFLDTIQITGKNFGKSSLETSVHLDTKYASIISFNDSAIRFIVPVNIEVTSPEIMVSSGDKKTRVDGKFKLFKPQITSIEPEQGTFRDLVEIKGEHFDTDPQRIQVFFGVREANIAGASRNRLTVVVPDDIEENTLQIKVKTHLQEVVSSSSFHLSAPIITKVPVSGKSGDEVTIEGSNFHPLHYKNKVYFGEAEAEIINVGKAWIKVKVPAGPYLKTEVKIKVGVLGLETTSESYFTIEDTYRMITNTLPFYLYTNALGNFVIENKAYVIAPELNMGQDPKWYLWVFNPSDYSWQKKSLPVEATYESICYGNGEKGYLYLSQASDNFYEYNATTDSWTKKKDFPGVKRTRPAMFSIDTEMYVGLGAHDGPVLVDFYRYSPSTDDWTRIEDLDTGEPEHMRDVRVHATTFSINGMGYVGGGATTSEMYDFWKYNKNSNTWTRMADLSYPPTRVSAFVWEGKGYAVDGGINEYDPITNIWRFKDESPATYGSIAFVVSNTIYITGGDWPNYSLYQVDMSKF